MAEHQRSDFGAIVAEMINRVFPVCLAPPLASGPRRITVRCLPGTLALKV
jgi:hypothetical protein